MFIKHLTDMHCKLACFILSHSQYLRMKPVLPGKTDVENLFSCPGGYSFMLRGTLLLLKRKAALLKHRHSFSLICRVIAFCCHLQIYGLQINNQMLL